MTRSNGQDFYRGCRIPVRIARNILYYLLVRERRAFGKDCLGKSYDSRTSVQQTLCDSWNNRARY